MNHFMNLLILLFMLTCFSYGNISHMVHELAHGNADFSQYRDVAYAYDQLNWLTKADDAEQDYFDEIFAYDPQGRIVAQRRDTSIAKNIGDEYAYYANTNRLKSIANGMGGSADSRSMSDPDNFVYDTDGNLIEDKSKSMRISYDWRGMPSSFTRELEGGDSLRLELLYDGSGRRISKTRWSKANGAQDWEKELVTHYTGIGTEVRENLTGASSETKVVVNMPQNLGRYGVEYADAPSAATTYAWFLHDHLGSTVAVYGSSENGEGQLDLEHAYEYRSFGEMAELASSADKVTENFTGKELDDETQFTYHGARYLDPMLGMWISVDPMRQFTSLYLYAGNGYNPVNGVDPDGNEVKGTFSKSTRILTLRDNDSGKEVSGKYFTGGIAGAPIPNGTYEILEQAQREGFYRLDLVDVNPRNDVAELPDGSTRDRFRLHGQGMSLACVTACEGTDHSKIDKFLQNTKTSVVKDNYDAPWYVDLKNFFSGSDNESNINKYGELDVTE